MILLNAAESRELDRVSIEEFGIDSYLLMTRAGESVADALVENFSKAASDVMIVAGKGNNGGDGFVAGRRLLEAGFGARAILLARATDLKGDAARAVQSYRDAGGAGGEGLDESILRGAFEPHPEAGIDGIF